MAAPALSSAYHRAEVLKIVPDARVHRREVAIPSSGPFQIVSGGKSIVPGAFYKRIGQAWTGAYEHLYQCEAPVIIDREVPNAVQAIYPDAHVIHINQAPPDNVLYVIGTKDGPLFNATFPNPAAAWKAAYQLLTAKGVKLGFGSIVGAP